MRKFYFILGICLILGCGPEAKIFTTSYSIQNTLSHPVELNFYRDIDLIESLSLGENETFEGEKLERYSQPWSSISDTLELNLLPSDSFGTSDSIVIIFNNQYRLKYTVDRFLVIPSEPLDQNIYRHYNYHNLGQDRYLIVIDEEDFQYATPCNGECN